MLHFKVSSYLYISTGIDGQDLYLDLLQFTVSFVYCLKPSSFHFFLSFLSFSSSLYHSLPRGLVLVIGNRETKCHYTLCPSYMF